MPSTSATWRGVLTAGAAEAAQREARDVVAALHGDLLDRVRHALDGDADEARCEVLGAGASPVAAPTSRANAANAPVVALASSGSSAFGPNTRGKWSGSIRPSSRFASVTVSGPPRR